MDKAQRIFMSSLAIVCLGLSVAVYQVAQPWRGILIAALLLSLVAGVPLLRLARIFAEYKVAKLHAPAKAPVGEPPAPIRGRGREVEVRRVSGGDSGPVVL